MFKKAFITVGMLGALAPAWATTGLTGPLTVTVGSLTRTYELYIPSGCQSGSGNPCPLVIVFHGGGMHYDSVFTNTSPNINPQSVWSTEAQPGGTQSIADQYNVIIASPNGTDDTSLSGNFGGTSTGHGWNDCTGFFPGYYSSLDSFGSPSAPSHPVDDVAFIRAIITDIGARGYTVNSKKIYATGMSNGSNMVLRLAREASDILAAGAVESGGDGAVPSLLSNEGTPSSINTNAPNYSTAWPGIASTNGNTYTDYNLKISDKCQYSQVNGSGQLVSNPQPNPVPLWMIHGQSDLFVSYGGGTSVSGSHTWYIPYDPSFVNATSPKPGFPSAYSGTSPTYADPWQNPTTGLDSNKATLPGGITTLSLIWSRYSLGSNPSYTTTTYGSSITCKNYGVGTRAEVDSCVVLNNGHIEPSINQQISSSGETYLGKQNHDIETAVKEWAFFQRFTHP